jgi:hypothetical protein
MSARWFTISIMRMAISQPSAFLVVLIPLDREARDWYHTQWVDGDPAPRYLHPLVAEIVVNGFEADGGELVPH